MLHGQILPSGMMEAETVVPTLKAFSLRAHDNQQMILAAGDQEAVVISPGGSILTSVDLPALLTHALITEDFSNDGLTDIIVMTSNGIYGFVQTRQPGALFFITEDFSNDGLTDIIVMTSNGIYGFVQTRQPGALFFSTLVGCLLVVMGVIFVTQHLNSTKGKPRASAGSQ
ncbi:hypothetical protein SLEP1_g49051 [Rubroshorea leprosula]|uniref:FG-GAP repeat-containing protein n=1 Tax=Rubroshorea leprosula TaxID=152421 RepID=A0AAV5LVV0_9ROSI|nr:hypothetical protein SLEP1_g49051 [Rubroshorea leprosula]